MIKAYRQKYPENNLEIVFNPMELLQEDIFSDKLIEYINLADKSYISGIDDFNNLVIKQEGDKLVRFKDIGVAEVDAEDTRSIMKRNGVPMVACVVIPQPGANYIDIVNEAYQVMEDLQKDLRTQTLCRLFRFIT